MSLDTLIARCTVALANAGRKLQTLQIRMLAGELKDGMEHLEPYGYTSCPKPGAEGVAVFPGGDRSHGVVVVISDRRFRLQGLKPGEVALYTDEGDKIHFERGHKLTIKTGTLNVEASEEVHFKTPSLKHNNVNVGATHAHGGIQPGDGNSAGPH